MNLAARNYRPTLMAALAVAHLAFFQLFLFANTAYTFAESALHHVHRAFSPSHATFPPSNLQGAQNVPLPHHR